MLTLKFEVWRLTFAVWRLKFKDSTLRFLNFEDFYFRSFKFEVWRLKFEDFHFRTLKLQVWSFSLSQFEDSTLRFLNFEDFHFRTLKFLTFAVSSLRFQLWDLNFEVSRLKFEGFHFRFLSLSRRRPSLRVAGQATDISPLAVAFILADGARAKTIANHSSRFGSAFSVFGRSANHRSRLA